MLTDTQAGHAGVVLQAGSMGQEASPATQVLYRERKWREFEHCAGPAIEDVAISRWTDLGSTCRHEEATTPSDRYFIGIALKTTRLRLTRGRQTIFDGIMPAGTLYVNTPSQQLSAQFDAPFDFLHFHISADYFQVQRATTQPVSNRDLNDLVLLRNSFAEQLAKALVENGGGTDRKFARCVGQTLAIHVARLESPQTKVNVLPKWRLRRVEEYVRANFDRCISLSDLAKVAGLSRMHFAAQFRTATGYRPHEYLLHQRIEHAKSLLSSSEMPLAEVALAVGFCTQAHFSTVFKRLAGETPARWRYASKNESPTIKKEGMPKAGSYGQGLELRRVA
jgi:AraC family transcriptional regulator